MGFEFELPSYVGITGFKYPEQVTAVRGVAQGPRILMVGVLASQKSIVAGNHDPESRNAHREKIAEIFPPGDQTLNLVHYYTKDQENLIEQLDEVTYFGGPRCHGLQLNIAWPDPLVLSRFRNHWPERILVLQLGGRRWPLTNYTPDDLGKKVLDYDGIVDYVLLDPSGGLGREMDVAFMQEYLEGIDRSVSVARRQIKLAVAGGLNADTVSALQPLCEEFPGLSFDAEGKLHGASGALDLVACKQYLQTAAQLP